MKALRQAVQVLLEQLKLPVWETGQAPSGTAMPYVAWTMEDGGFWDVKDMVATCWYRGDHAGCVATLQAMRAMLPEDGRVLRFPGGMAVCYRGASSLVEDAHDRCVCGGRLHVEMHIYANQEGDEGC